FTIMKQLGLLLMAMLLSIGMYANDKTIKSDSISQATTVQNEGLKQSVKDSILFQKLSSDQLMELKRQENELEQQKIEANNHNADIPLNGFGIVMICLMPFLLVASIIFTQAKVRNRESQRKYDLYMKSLEMGQTVPEHFFDEPKKTDTTSNLKRGILWLVVGLALTISFLVIKEKEALILGIVPTFVGIGYLLVNKLDKPKTDTTTENNEQHG
ncbi:MAG: DUF6249 domain-containing protein, partial [Paludibacter sp.]